jgi:hypothetical protein
LRPACELGTEVFALRSNTRRTGIQVALAGHVTTQSYQGRCAKAKFFGSQHRPDYDITPGLQTSIDTQSYALTQSIAH